MFNPNISAGDMTAIAGMGIEAVKRWQALIKPNGDVMWGGTTLGTEFTKRGCTLKQLPASLCAPMHRNDSAPWPVASVILKIKGDGSNARSALQTMRSWRTTTRGHLPMMTSPQVAAGFGYASRFLAKVVPCDKVPSQFRYLNRTCVSCAGKTRGKTQWQENWEAWTGLW
jgi:hypothetical protein